MTAGPEQAGGRYEDDADQVAEERRCLRRPVAADQRDQRDDRLDDEHRLQQDDAREVQLPDPPSGRRGDHPDDGQ
jgi:hypothetical protein